MWREAWRVLWLYQFPPVVVAVWSVSHLRLCDPMDCSLPGSCVRAILQQGYWSRLPFPSPGDLPKPGSKPRSPALQTESLQCEPPGKPKGTRVGCHALHPGIFLTQGSNPCLLGFLYWPVGSLPVAPPGKNALKHLN